MIWQVAVKLFLFWAEYSLLFPFPLSVWMFTHVQMWNCPPASKPYVWRLLGQKIHNFCMQKIQCNTIIRVHYCGSGFSWVYSVMNNQFRRLLALDISAPEKNIISRRNPAFVSCGVVGWMHFHSFLVKTRLKQHAFTERALSLVLAWHLTECHPWLARNPFGLVYLWSIYCKTELRVFSSRG